MGNKRGRALIYNYVNQMPAYVTNLIGIPLSFPHQENCTAIPVKQAWKLKYHQNKHCLMDWIYTKVRIGAWQFEEKKKLVLCVVLLQYSMYLNKRAQQSSNNFNMHFFVKQIAKRERHVWRLAGGLITLDTTLIMCRDLVHSLEGCDTKSN